MFNGRLDRNYLYYKFSPTGNNSISLPDDCPPVVVIEMLAASTVSNNFVILPENYPTGKSFTVFVYTGDSNVTSGSAFSVFFNTRSTKTNINFNGSVYMQRGAGAVTFYSIPALSTINPTGTNGNERSLLTWMVVESPSTGVFAYGANYTSRSTRLGYNAISSGVAGVAIGGNSSAYSQSTALGASATASGGSSLSISAGNGTTAGSLCSTAIGSTSGHSGSVTATGAGAMALGGSYASGTDSFAAVVANNTSTYGAQATGAIAIGTTCKVTGSKGTSIGGDNNLTSGAFAVTLGGEVNTASGQTSFATGERSIATQYGKRAHGAFIAAAGDNQYGRITLGAVTTGSAVVLTSNRAGATSANQLIVASNQVMAFTGVLIGKQTGSADIAAYEIKGTLVNNGGTVTMPTGTITLIGSDSITLTAAPTLAADNTNKGMTVTSGYKTATNINWSCTIHSTELTFA